MELIKMFNRKQKFIVLDVEGYSTVRPYNIGYIVADKYGKIYCKRSFALPESVWENINAMLVIKQAEEMTRNNIEEILLDIGNKKRKRKYKTVSIATFKKMFTADIQKYKIKILYAYNVSFDKSALKRIFGEEEFKNLPLEYRDIISGILYTKLLTKKYIQFCRDNGFLTAKGNIQTKAEIVYKYLTNSLNFIEEHTGLADCLIEYQILLSALKSRKKIDWSPVQAWKKINNFIEENNI